MTVPIELLLFVRFQNIYIKVGYVCLWQQFPSLFTLWLTLSSLVNCNALLRLARPYRSLPGQCPNCISGPENGLQKLQKDASVEANRVGHLLRGGLQGLLMLPELLQFVSIWKYRQEDPGLNPHFGKPCFMKIRLHCKNLSELLVRVVFKQCIVPSMGQNSVAVILTCTLYGSTLSCCSRFVSKIL